MPIARIPLPVRAAIAVVLASTAWAALGPPGSQIAGYHVGVLATAAALAFAVPSRPAFERSAWVMIAAGAGSFAIGHTFNTLAWVISSETLEMPLPFEVLCLVMYPLLAVGIVRLIRARAPGTDWGSLIDAAIITLGVAALVWVTLLQPRPGDPAAPALQQALLLIYPSFDAVLLAATAVLAFRVRPLTGRLLVLMAAMVVLLTTDVVYAVAVREGTSQGHPLALGWWLTFVLLATAAWLPTRTTTVPPSRELKPLGHLRLVALAGTTVLVPVTALIGGGSVRARSLDLVAAVLSLLVFLRLSGLVRALAASREEVVALQQQREERRFRSLVQNAADIVLVLSADLQVTYASPSAERLLGLNPVGLSPDDLMALFHPADLAAVEHGLSAGGPAAALTARMRDSDGDWRYLEILATDLTADADVGGLVLNIRDVTERAALERQLRRLALHDPLTGLANRVMFAELVQEALDSGDHDGIAVLFCDVDDFKTVNDSLGHDAGDALLLALSQRLALSLRDGDVAARLGGDEFGVLLVGLPHQEEAGHIAERLIATLRDPIDLAGTQVTPSVSIGIASGDVTPAELLRNADAAMYDAKRAGAGLWRRYSPTLHHRALARLQLTTDLSGALGRREFELDYQPVVDLADLRVTGVEALVRWSHPQRGRISPLDFIPLAEETGAIIDLGAWVLHEACRQMALWQQTLPHAPRVVHVNVSARELHAPGFASAVSDALAATGLAAESLVLELTESVLLEDPEAAAATFATLRALGISIAIDDFGTGYSSLSYLRDLPVDILKIDRAFIQDLGHGIPAQTVARGILDLAQALGVRTVAEGVETSAQLIDLRTLGCQTAQGYHLSRPLAAPAIVELLRQRILPADIGADPRHPLLGTI